MASRADQRKYHYIYKITRTDGSGKYYIGMHSTDNLEDGYFGSGKILSRSIKKHGKEAHSKEILEQLKSRTELKAREKEIVNVECLADKKCMNLKLGGEGGQSSEISLQSWQSSERRIIHSMRMKEKLKNELLLSSMTSHSSKTLSASHAVGKIKYDTFTGKQHTHETKIKIGLAVSISQTGEKNSQFGTCWVTNGVKPVKIKKELLDGYLLSGYSRGRK